MVGCIVYLFFPFWPSSFKLGNSTLKRYNTMVFFLLLLIFSICIISHVLSFDGYSNMNWVMILQNHDLIGVENINYKNETIFDRKKKLPT